MKERVIMAYHTTPYLLLFLPAALLFYQITPAKWRSYTLLIFSYLFFWSFSEKLIIYLIGTTFLTHHICIWMDTMDKRDKRKQCEENTACHSRKKRREGRERDMTVKRIRFYVNKQTNDCYINYIRDGRSAIFVLHY